MLLVAFVQWWYGPGWRDSADRLAARIHDTYLSFSMPILMRTIFAPWRRIVTNPGASIGDRFRAGVDNFISRAVGSAMRIGTLITGLLFMAFYLIVGGLILVTWPVLPWLGPILIVVGVLV